MLPLREESLARPLLRRAKLDELADMAPSSVTISTWSCVPTTDGSMASEKETVDKVAVPPPMYDGPSSYGIVLATTATLATSAGEGVTAKSAVEEPGRPGVVVLRSAGGLLGEVTDVKALTIDPMPYPLSPANADPILPFGVVPNPVLPASLTTSSSSTWSSSGSVDAGGSQARLLIRLVRGRPRGLSSSASSPSRRLMERAQEMISSRLRDEADEATIAATGEVDVLRVWRELVRPRERWERSVDTWAVALPPETARTGRRGGVIPTGLIGSSSSPSLLSDVDRKTDSGAVPGVLAPPVDLASRLANISLYLRPSSLTDVRPGDFGVMFATISRRANAGRTVLLRCSRRGNSIGGEFGAEGKENARRSRGAPAGMTGAKSASDAGGRKVAARVASGGRGALGLVGEALDRRRSSDFTDDEG